MTNPTAETPEGWRIGAGFAEFLHGVGHGDLDGEPEECPLCDQPGGPHLECSQREQAYADWVSQQQALSDYYPNNPQPIASEPYRRDYRA